MGHAHGDRGEVVDLVVRLSEADAATGWCAMIGIGTAAAAAVLPREGAEEMWPTGEEVCGGALAPAGARSLQRSVIPPCSRGEATAAYRSRYDSYKPAAVDAVGLVKTFGQLRAVDGIDLEVRQGEIFGVLGPNGAGKTTTLQMLATLLPIDAGQARVFGVDVAREPHRVRQLIGVTGQYASVDEDLTATENLWLFGRLQGLRSADARAAAKRLLAQFGLEEAADKPISQFSGGMRRRLDLAASLITRPPLIFLDEPTTGLDPRTRGQMWDTIRGLVADGCTVLLTTQYLDEADQLADRIAVIDRGRKVAEGTPDELKASVGNSTLQLQLAAGADQELARQIVRRVAGAEPVLTPESGRMNVPLDTADRAADVLIALRQAGVAIASVSVDKPTLDEVFLAITGHGADDDAGPQPDTGLRSRHRPRDRSGGPVSTITARPGTTDRDPLHASSTRPPRWPAPARATPSPRPSARR